MKKSPCLFHKNFEFKNIGISIKIMKRIYYPFKYFCIKFTKFKDKNIYFFELKILGWDVLTIGVLNDL